MVTSKGKGRATPRFDASSLRRDLPVDIPGNGDPNGVVLALEYSENGPYDVIYSLPVLVGSGPNAQNFSLQVDTGSSDLWIASTSCSCGSVPLYDPSEAIPTGKDFNIQYLMGNVSGPVFWDTVTIGNFSISNQALAAADFVQSEPLTPQFSGVLGLALPDDSIIRREIRPQVGNTPDGAILASNLFSITPVSAAPSARFISITLERPGSSTVPSVLGIGQHPPSVVPDPSLVEYDALYDPTDRGYFWKVAVRAITVYTNNTRIPIQLGRGASGGAFPSASLDTGTPLILTTTAVADAIYGAIGIQRASDNMYYVPCTTPLNLTVTLDSRGEIPVHPLDLTTDPPSTSTSPDFCIGMIQNLADAQLSSPNSPIGDMILGVPFLRNTYTVLAYDQPFDNGTFPGPSAADAQLMPFLGLMALTNATIAMEEFHRVRVLNQPLGDTGQPVTTDSGGHKQNVGIDVLIGLGSFAALCVLLFGVRWLLVRRSLRREADNDLSVRDAKTKDLAIALGGFPLTKRGDDGMPTEDELRQRRFTAYKQSLHTVSTDRTSQLVGEDGTYRDSKELAPSPPPPPQLVDILPSSPTPFLVPEQSQQQVPESGRHSRVLSVNLPLIPDVGGVDEDMNSTPMTGIGSGRHSAYLRGRSPEGPDYFSVRHNSASGSRSPGS
ncbi:aspartic peptidase domain-containing protein [Roridomyces roridus]|uniref:Aspartic peptidase domain-containing protein n=1 Tax=Roridomyces roridus TaxID=1738132 RepID=A0AAD7BYR3_9AGAR|nr:aspartic peptidase domain-containing protein [Roridomyces roridus]